MAKELEHVNLIDTEDSIRWTLFSNWQFSTSSLYRHCSFSEVVDVRMEELWKSKLPLKIKNFIWLVCRGKIQMTNNMKRKRWKGVSYVNFA
jgi:hypothetical protein